ncbi:MAG: hypothetical protein AAF202_01710 [Pseudomonadota bacterium]
MKLFKMGLLIVSFFCSISAFGSASAGGVTVNRILTWTNGDYKVYFNERDKINAMSEKEGCTSVDGSVAVVSKSTTQQGEKNILTQLMYAKATNKKVNVFIVGCCKNHNQKLSPCVRTVTGY